MSPAALGASPHPLLAWGRSGAWLAALGLVICLLGCQPRVNNSPSLPPPVPAAVPLSRPVHPTFYVTVNELRLRACPGKDCPQTTTLPLNAEVEKLEEIENWTQVRVKKDGTIGYVNSRYLSPQPAAAAKPIKKKLKIAKHRKPAPSQEVAGKEDAAAPQKQEPSLPLPKVM